MLETIIVTNLLIFFAMLFIVGSFQNDVAKEFGQIRRDINEARIEIRKDIVTR